MLVAAVMTAPTVAEVAPGAKPVVAVVEIATPWYAPAFLVRGRMRDTAPLYASLPGLAFKYFSISEEDRFGGIYLWQTATAARAWFNEAWFANVLQTRGAPASVRYFEVLHVQDMVPGGVQRDDHSSAAATLVTASSTGAWGDAGSAPGLLRRYDVRDANGWPARIDLWSSNRAARAHYDEGRLAQLRATLGIPRVQYFATPILLPTSQPSGRFAGPS